MEKLKEFIIDSVISIGIGLAVGSFYMFVILSKYIGCESVLKSLFLSGLIGFGIGLAAKSVFILERMNIIKNAKLVYIIEGIVITLLSAFASYLMKVRSVNYILIMSLIALSLGMMATWMQYRSWKISNEKLKEYQNKIKQ